MDSSVSSLALLSILPLGLMFDMLLPRHRAILCTLLFGFLFLPEATEIEFGGLLKWNKYSATSLTILLGVMMRDRQALSRLRPSWADLALLLFILSHFPTSITNGLGAYDGLVQAVNRAILFGGAYLVGRMHFAGAAQVKDLFWAILIGGMIYLPLCLFEIRFSPMLHSWVYGYQQHLFAQTVRGSTYRPMVFMNHGLMVAMWMFCSTLLLLCRKQLGFARMPFGLPAGLITFAFLVVFLAMRSTGAAILLFTAFVIWQMCSRGRKAWPLLALALVPLFWTSGRVGGVLNSHTFTEAAATVLPEQRARSFAFRLEAEDLLIRHTESHQQFGWGLWGRNQVIESGDGRARRVTIDGLWLSVYSVNGLLGLAGLLLVQLAPILLGLRAAPPRLWATRPEAARIGFLALLLAAYSVDNLMNAMVSPHTMLISGCLISVYQRQRVTGSVGATAPELRLAGVGPQVVPRFRRVV